MSCRHHNGQSILEVILALAIFALFAAAMVSLILGSFETLGRGGDYLAAAALAEEGLEAVRSIRDGAWNELIFNRSAATSTSGEWQFAGEGTDEQIGKFHRVLTFSPVCRDSSLNLLVCPAGPVDLHSREAQVAVDWINPVGAAAAVERQTIFTNWDSHDWLETDWTGQTGTNIDVNTAGELKLLEIPPVWSLFTDTGAETWNDIACPSASNCWAVGNSGALASYNGSGWTESVIPSPAHVNGLYALSASDIWAAGANGRLWRYNGSRWSLFVDTGNQIWKDIFMISATDGFVVGPSNNLRRWNNPIANTWNNLTSGSSQTLNAVHCASASNCFAVGGSGQIVRWTGGPNWSLFQDTGNQIWNDVFMISATDGFVVGTGGQVRRWNHPTSGTWNTVPGGSGSSQTLNAVHCASASNCFAVGANGRIVYWNGATWSLSPSLPTAQNLNAVFLLSANEGWAAGGSGTILHFLGGGYETSGELVSSAFDLTDPSPVQIIEWDEQIPVCVPVSACNVKFKIRVADDSTMTGVPWPPDSEFFTVSAGTLIPVSYNGRRWVQYRVFLSGDGKTTPILNEVRINYK